MIQMTLYSKTNCYLNLSRVGEFSGFSFSAFYCILYLYKFVGYNKKKKNQTPLNTQISLRQSKFDLVGYTKERGLTLSHSAVTEQFCSSLSLLT